MPLLLKQGICSATTQADPIAVRGWTTSLLQKKRSMANSLWSLKGNELEEAAGEWQTVPLLENQCSQGVCGGWKERQLITTYSSIRVSRGSCSKVLLLSPLDEKVEIASLSTEIPFQCTTPCIHKLSISSPVRPNRPGNPLWYDTQTVACKTEHRFGS